MKILVAGGNGFLGKHVCSRIDPTNLLSPSSSQFNLTYLRSCREYIRQHDPDLFINLAGVTDGIEKSQNMRLELLAKNAQIGINAAILADEFNLPTIAAGSVCSMPETKRVPWNESDFTDEGRIDPDNFAYGNGKRVGYHALSSSDAPFVYLVLANMYGPGDKSSHVIPDLVRKIAGQPKVMIFGSGKQTRDFLYVEDAADAFVRAIDLFRGRKSIRRLREVINIGSGCEYTINEVAYEIAFQLDREPEFVYDYSKPVGNARRLLSIDYAREFLEWGPKTSLKEGISKYIADILQTTLQA